MNKQSFVEIKLPEVIQDLNFTKRLLQAKMKSVQDLEIMLNLYSSKSKLHQFS